MNTLRHSDHEHDAPGLYGLASRHRQPIDFGHAVDTRGRKRVRPQCLPQAGGFSLILLQEAAELPRCVVEIVGIHDRRHESRMLLGKELAGSGPR